jgi:hypothetical protein
VQYLQLFLFVQSRACTAIMFACADFSRCGIAEKNTSASECRLLRFSHLLRANHGIFRDGSLCVGFSIVWKVCVINNYCFYAVAVKLVVQGGVLTRAPFVFCPFKIYAGMLNRFVFL